MKPAFTFGCWISYLMGIAIVLGFTAGCDSDTAARRRLTTKLAAATKETTDLLATVKDKPTAEAARPKIQRLIDQVDAWTEQVDSMDTSVGMGDKVTLESHAQWIGEQTRLMQEQYRIGQIAEAREGLGDTWQQLTGGAYDPGGVFGPGGKMDMGAIMNPPAVPGLLPGNAPAQTVPGK